MNSLSKYKVIALIFGIILLLCFTYLLIFGRALSQDENHLGIALALPKLILGADAVKIDNEKYLTKNSDSLVKAMENQGFAYLEQMGAGYFFEKNGERYLSTSRMYSSHFMVFTVPSLID
jgi:hypothetical protein